MASVWIGVLIYFCLCGSAEATNRNACQHFNDDHRSPQSLLPSCWQEESLRRSNSTINHRLHSPGSNKVIVDLSFANVTKSCAVHLTHLMEQDSRFLQQSHNIAESIAARLHRLQDVWPASFQQCLSIRSTLSSTSGNTKIQGQYCLPYFFAPIEKMNFEQARFIKGQRPSARYPVALPQTGLCLPHTCTSNDAQKLLKFYLSEAATNWTIYLPPEQCQTDNKKPVTLFTKVVVAGIIVLLLLVIAGTIIEVYDYLNNSKKGSKKVTENGEPGTQDNDSFSHSAIKCFSLFSNVLYLFKMDVQVPGNVEAFNGARFLAALGCQVFHVVLLGNWGGWKNIDEANFIQSVCHQGLFHLPVLLEIAVIMSGANLALSAYHRIHQKDKQLFVIPFYLRRIYRLSIPYFVFLALLVGILPHLSSGPRWPDILHNVEICKKYWWTNVLFINNYVHVETLCQIHSWYLSADVQLLLIAPILIMAFNRSARLGITVMLALISLSVGKLGYHAFYDGLNSLNVNDGPSQWKIEQYFGNLYFLPYSRLGCYSLAIGLGYFIYAHGKNFHVSLTVQRCTSYFFAILFWLPFFLWYYFENISPPTLFQASLCEAFGRISWSASVCCLTFALEANFQDAYTRAFRWLLYRKIFVLTSKLSYSVYLIHLTVIQVFFATRPEPLEFTGFTFLLVMFGLLAIAHVLAVPFSLLAELPFVRLERLFEQRRNRNKVSQEDCYKRNQCKVE